MALTPLHVVGILLALGLIIFVGWWSGRKVKSAADFDSGGSSGAIIVGGAIMGTLVGGSSTVGTAQLAFTYGMSAWWFTLGGGISCLVLGLLFAGSLRKSGCTTITQLISREYGNKAGMLATVLSSVGIFINLLAQLIAAQALITTLFPQIGLFPSTLFAVALMAAYVIFGGVLAAGLVGVVKLVLLYIAVIAAGVLCLTLDGGGLSTFWTALPHETYFSLIARGAGTDLGAGLSLLLGVLSTQSYAQAVLSGKSDSAARRGAVLSAFMIPPIGIGGILVGMFMRLNYPDITAAQAFPLFIVNHMPALFAGIVLAALLIAIVGTGAGLALGISTVVSNDIIRRRTHRFDEAKKSLALSRIIIVIVLAAGLVLTVVGMGDIILNFSFMSMGLRAAVVFCPLCGALFFPGKVDRRFAVAAIIAGPLLVLVGNLMALPFDPLFIGMVGSLALICVGGVAAHVRPKATAQSRETEGKNEQ